MPPCSLLLDWTLWRCPSLDAMQGGARCDSPTRFFRFPDHSINPLNDRGTCCDEQVPLRLDIAAGAETPVVTGSDRCKSNSG